MKAIKSLSFKQQQDQQQQQPSSLSTSDSRTRFFRKLWNSNTIKNPLKGSMEFNNTDDEIQFSQLGHEELNSILLPFEMTFPPQFNYNGETVVQNELEGFCLSFVRSIMLSTKAYEQIVHHEAADLLLSSVAGTMYKSLSKILPSDKNMTFDCDGLRRMIFNRLHAVTNNVIRRKSRILSLAKCVVGSVSSLSEQGMRKTNEDQHVSIPYLNQLIGNQTADSLSYFAVFDGHGGVECAQYVASHLHPTIARHPQINTNVKQALTESFLKVNSQWADAVNRSASLSPLCGSTGVVALLQEKNICIAWVGDSSAILFLKDGLSLDFVFPHKPTFENEKKRIEQLGGFVQNGRVNGALAVSRSFGDIKHMCILPEPEIMEYTLTGNELFLLLACDGLTDVLDPMQIFEIVNNLHKAGIYNTDIITRSLIDEALKRDTTDNVSVIYISLDKAMVFSEHAINDEMRLTPVQRMSVDTGSPMSNINANIMTLVNTRERDSMITEESITASSIDTEKSHVIEEEEEEEEVSPRPVEQIHLSQPDLSQYGLQESNDEVFVTQRLPRKRSISYNGNTQPPLSLLLETERTITPARPISLHLSSLMESNAMRFSKNNQISELRALTELSRQLYDYGGISNPSSATSPTDASTSTSSTTTTMIVANDASPDITITVRDNQKEGNVQQETQGKNDTPFNSPTVDTTRSEIGKPPSEPPSPRPDGVIDELLDSYSANN